MNPEPSTSFYRSEGDSVTNLILPNFRIRCGSANNKKKSNSGCLSENKKNPNQRPNRQQKIQNCIKSKKKILTYSKFNHYYYQISCASYSKVLFYSCRLCTFSLKKKKSLYKHFRVNHPDIFPFPCRFCTSGFMFSGVRRNHELKYHTPSCSICKLNFCCQTDLAEHCKACLISVFNGNNSNNNPVNIYRQCETCISKFNNEICHKKSVPVPNIKRRLIQDHIEIVSSSTNFNSVVMPKKIKQVNIRSMPLLNSYEDMNVSLERNNYCARSSLHNNKCKVRDNNANNCCGTLQDLFGPISDSESEVSIKEEIVDLEFENDWRRCNSLQLYSPYRNTSDKATQTIINGVFMSKVDTHLSLSNLDYHRSSSKFNFNPFTSNCYKESFCSYNNNDQYMKCYVCSFNTFKIDLMVEHWSKNHSKIHMKALSDNMNELMSQKQTEKKQKAHNTIKGTACNEKKATAHIKTRYNRKKETDINGKKLTAQSQKKKTAHHEKKEIDFYEKNLMALSKAAKTLPNDKKALPHNGKIQTPLNEKEESDQSEKKESNLNVRTLMAQSKIKESILKDKEAIAQNNKIQTPLNEMEVTAQKERKETDFYVDRIMAQSETKETLLNDMTHDKKAMDHIELAPPNKKRVTAQSIKKEFSLNKKKLTVQREAGTTLNKIKQTNLNTAQPVNKDTALHENKERYKSERKETDFYKKKQTAQSKMPEIPFNEKELICHNEKEVPAQNIITEIPLNKEELIPHYEKLLTSQSIMIEIPLNKEELIPHYEKELTAQSIMTEKPHSEEELTSHYKKEVIAQSEKKETAQNKKKLTAQRKKNETSVNQDKVRALCENKGTDFNGNKLTALCEITKPILNEEKLAPCNKNEVTASQMKETPCFDRKAMALNDMIQTPLDEKEVIAQDEKNEIALNNKKDKAQREALSRQMLVGLRYAIQSPYKTYYLRPSNKVDYSK